MKTKQRDVVGLRLAGCAGIFIGLLLPTGCTKKERVNLFEGSAAQEALTELSTKFTQPARALNLEITPLKLTVRVQDPAQSGHVDEYSYEHRYLLVDRIHQVSVSGPRPVQLDLINPKLEENLFNLGDVNIAGTAETARIQRQLHLIPVATRGDVEWDFSVKSDREYASVYADAKGRITRLNLDGTDRAKNLDLFADNKELLHIVGMMRETLGSKPGILKLTLNRNLIAFDARNPRKPARLMSFRANLNGVLMQMDAFSGGPGAPPLPDGRFFGVDEVDWTRVPEIQKQAAAKLAIPNGKLYKVTLAKPTFEGEAQPLGWTIEIKDDEGEDGEVEFDPRGSVTHVTLPKSRRAEVKMFDAAGMTQAIEGMKRTFGAHARIIELAFDDHHATITAGNPKKPGRLRDFMFDGDHFADFAGTDMTPFYRELQDASFFDLDEIQSTLPPQLAELEKAAIKRLKLKDGKLNRIVVARQQKMQPPGAKVAVEMRVKDSTDREGSVTFDLQGNIVRVMTP